MLPRFKDSCSIAFGNGALINNPKTNYVSVPKAVRKTRRNGEVKVLRADGDGNLAFAASFAAKRRAKKPDLSGSFF